MNYPLLFSLLLVASLGATASSFGQTPMPSTTPTLDQSVTFQNNIRHDGNDSMSSLLPPLALKWKQDLTSSGVTSISYPLIAQGRVIVTTMDDLGEKSVIAFDETNGEQLWSVSMPGTYGFINAAYDSDKVFVVNFDGLMWALDAASGTQVWSVQLPGQYSFTSPPTAADGLVFVGGAGSGERCMPSTRTMEMSSGRRVSRTATIVHRQWIPGAFSFPMLVRSPMPLRWRTASCSGTTAARARVAGAQPLLSISGKSTSA